MDKVIQKGLWEKMRCKIIEKNDDAIELEMTLEELHKRDLGIVHGGAIGALIDFSMTSLLNSKTRIMSDYKINFLKMGDGSHLIAKASRLVKGDSTSPIYCEIFNDRNEVIADAIGHCGTLNEVVDGEIKQDFQFDPELNGNVPAYVFEEDGTIPFNSYLGIKQTYWSKGCVQMELNVEQKLRDQNDKLPTAHFITLVDVACGQALKTVLAVGEGLLTIELSVTILRDFSNANKLIARGKVQKHGKISVIYSVILNENLQLLAYGTTTYYIKR